MELVKNLKDVDYKLELLKSMKKDFKVINTTYTTTFVVNKKKIKYCSKVMNKNVFFAHNKIKKDLKESNFLKFVENNPISKKSETYYTIQDYLEETKGIEAINIDITNAYPSVLRLCNGITGETFEYINKRLNKPDKLAALGMLASKRTVYSYRYGILETLPEIEKKDTDEIFFFCVKYISYIIGECKKAAKGYFLFSWVDGLYIKRNTPRKYINEIKKVINDYGFNYSYENLKNMSIERKKDIILFTFEDENGKQKYINVPNYHAIRRTNQLIKNKLENKN